MRYNDRHYPIHNQAVRTIGCPITRPLPRKRRPAYTVQQALNDFVPAIAIGGLLASAFLLLFV